MAAAMPCVSHEVRPLKRKRGDDIAARDAVHSRKQMRQQPLPTLREQIRQQPLPMSISTLQSNGHFPWASKLNDVAKRVFGIDDLRSFLLPVINAVLSRQDCILFMPTGFGKSLCFQLPALLADGLTLVVSPFISVMEDHLVALKIRGVEAEMFTISIPTSKQSVILDVPEMVNKNSKMKILYVTPERVQNSQYFMTYLKKTYEMGRFSHFIVDEAQHCSHWGYYSGSEYGLVGNVRRQFPEVPVLCLATTATEAVIERVRKIFDMEGCIAFRARFRRRNLRYKVIGKSSDAKETVDNLSKMVRDNYEGQSGIVYCSSIKESNDLANELVMRGISARPYNEKLQPEERRNICRDWLSNRCQIVVATIGIDKPDVRFVIHYTICKSVEKFYEESGRAGHDGRPADCVVLFRMADVFWLSRRVFPDTAELQNFYKFVAYCTELKKCRRAILANHFGEHWRSSACNKMCDNCNVSLAEGGSSARMTETRDVTQYCIALLKIIENARKYEKMLTVTELMDAWSGKGMFRCDRRSMIDSFNVPQIECERIFIQLLVRGYFKEKFHSPSYTTLSSVIIGARGASVIAGRTKVFMEVLTNI